MGYYTRYELEVIEGNDYKTDYAEGISNESGYDCNLFGGEEFKWYDHERDMISYSVKHPNTVFKLTGYGEDSEDMWVAFFKNGKMHKSQAVITFEDYDESNLETYI